MTHRKSLSIIIIGLTLSLTSGCTHSVQKYKWVDVSVATSTMKLRDSEIETISATFSLLLQSGDGQIELKGAIVARPPNQLRLRAWKLSKTVLDITMNQDGLFIFTAKRNEQTTSVANSLTYERLIEAITILPGFGDVTSWEAGTPAVNTSTNQHIFTLKNNSQQNNSTMICSFDKASLTKRTCTYFDEQYLIRQVLTLDAYQLIHNIAWPMIIIGNGNGRTFQIHFSRVDINEGLSKRAFVPSRRAIKQS